MLPGRVCRAGSSSSVFLSVQVSLPLLSLDCPAQLELKPLGTLGEVSSMPLSPLPKSLGNIKMVVAVAGRLSRVFLSS